ncbi:MAG TPA: peptide chain release factor N(5)-glutamine methyltransferase [Candidatus Limnocylindria bacterium]|nr:peptide chain release factor N(5)-glutamine methyltransferase [Candidatus Limnocylindria bacterium]
MPSAEPIPVARVQSVGVAISAAAARLRASGSPTPRLDAELLVAHLAGRDRAWLLAHPEEPVTEPAILADLVERRATGEPIAYLRGFKEWRSLRIRTDARALVPRPETELLVDLAVADLADRLARDDAPIVAWDLGTGSGAIAVALALRFRAALALRRIRLVASDRSPDALELAAENLAHHRVADLVDLACAELLEPAGASLPLPDVVVANLPYVPSAEVAAAGGSLAHEPAAALDGGPDGLDVIRRLLADLASRGAPGGTVLLEVGAGQAEAIGALAPAGASVSVASDLAGIERVVRIGLSG